MVKHPPDVLITTPESLYLMLTSQARKIFEGTEWVIVDEIHAVAQTKRGAHLAITLERLAEVADRDVQRIGLSATQNPLEEVGPLPGRAEADVHGDRHRRAQAAGPEDPRPGRVDGRARPGHERRGPRPVHGPVRGRRRDPQVDLARDLPGDPAARPRAPLDDRVRQQPARRGAARVAAERAGRGGDRAGAPRLPGARGAARGRGPAEGRRAAVPGGDLVAGARHRHGRGRPGAAGRVAEVGHRRAAADRPCRPQRRRDVEGPHLPEVPRRPARVRGRRQADARGADRDHRRAAQPARRARAADRGDGRLDRVAERRRPPRARVAHPHLRRAVARPARERARHARRPLPVGGVRRAAPADRVGPRGGDDPRPQGLARAGDHQRRHDPRPRAVQREPARRPAGRRARRGDGLRGAAGPGLPAGRDLLADRGDHPRPRGRDAGAGRAGRGAVLEGRQRRAAARARRGDRRVLALGGRAGRGDAGGRLRPRPAGGARTSWSSCASRRRRPVSCRASARS